MKLFLLSGILVAAIVSGALQNAQVGRLPPTPFEDAGACPFEGCTYREWTAKELLTVRSARRDTAPVAFRVDAGERVTAVTGIVVTLQPGRVQFREPTTLRSAQGVFTIMPGESLYLLTYQGEGFTKAWLRGQLLTDVDTIQFINGVSFES